MILITGATGFIGSHLVKRLVEQGQRPRCLVRNHNQATGVLPGNKVEMVTGATTDYEALLKATRGVDTIIHAAFITADRKQSPGNHYYDTNVTGTENLVRAAKENGVGRIIEVSGLGTKPDKPGSYMQGRYQAEQMVKESGLQWTIIQPSVLFGKNAPFIKGLTDLIKTSPVVPLIGGGGLKFQPILVDDVVSVILKVLEDPEASQNKTYTIGGPEYYTFKQVIDVLMKTMRLSRLELPAPTLLVGIGAAVMEAVLPKPPLTKAAMTLFSFNNTTALDSVKRDFDFQPVSFKTYLEQNGI